MPTDTVEQADNVRFFREQLTEAGWQLANAVGEMRSPDGRLWIATTYSGGEYEVAVWKRLDSGPATDRVVYRVVTTDLSVLALALGFWLNSTNVSWPPIEGVRGS